MLLVAVMALVYISYLLILRDLIEVRVRGTVGSLMGSIGLLARGATVRHLGRVAALSSLTIGRLGRVVSIGRVAWARVLIAARSGSRAVALSHAIAGGSAIAGS